jgi:GDP-4-dehydro-6-deoxy-D-mannose reductase
MSILITGASGFAGCHLIEALKASGQTDIYGTVYNNPGIIKDLLPADHILSLNLMDQGAIDAVFAKIQPEQIYHLASFAFVGQSFDRAAELLNNNVVLQAHVLDAMLHHAPKARMLVVGSAEKYGLSEAGELPIKENHPFRPVNPYAVSKVAQDMLAYAYTVSHKLQIVRVRPFNHIGERQTSDFAVSEFARQIVAIERGKQQSLKVGNLEGSRDFTDVKDMMQAYMLLMEKGQSGEVYNVGSGVGILMSDVVKMLASFSTAKIEITSDDSRLRPLDIPEIIADPSKIHALGWKPEIPIEQTLKRVLEYWRKQA